MLNDIHVAFSPNSAKIPRYCSHYRNLRLSEILAMLRVAVVGDKDGSHFLRCDLQKDISGRCLPRSNQNTSSSARLLLIDGDSRVDYAAGELQEGAPCPYLVGSILQKQNIWHVIYGSHTHYTGNKGNRYRILLLTNESYNKAQLKPTIQAVINLINQQLGHDKLFNSNENNSWSQPWYIGRRPAKSAVENLYIEHLTGDFVTVHSPKTTEMACEKSPLLLPRKSDATINKDRIESEINPIFAFNQQFPLCQLFSHYQFRKRSGNDHEEKWLVPNSTSNVAGITYWPAQNKFYSHHASFMSDGKSHDSFDLFMVMEGLGFRDAVIRAAKVTKAPSGLSVDEHNKSLAVR